MHPTQTFHAVGCCTASSACQVQQQLAAAAVHVCRRQQPPQMCCADTSPALPCQPVAGLSNATQKRVCGQSTANYTRALTIQEVRENKHANYSPKYTWEPAGGCRAGRHATTAPAATKVKACVNAATSVYEHKYSLRANYTTTNAAATQTTQRGMRAQHSTQPKQKLILKKNWAP